LSAFLAFPVIGDNVSFAAFLLLQNPAVIFCETSNPTKRVIDQPPTVGITGQCRPDRGTIDKSTADHDYRMSTYDKAG
jgi:hypothetical protein